MAANTRSKSSKFTPNALSRTGSGGKAANQTQPGANNEGNSIATPDLSTLLSVLSGRVLRHVCRQQQFGSKCNAARLAKDVRHDEARFTPWSKYGHTDDGRAGICSEFAGICSFVGFPPFWAATKQHNEQDPHSRPPC